jgi:proteasome accessory factor C
VDVETFLEGGRVYHADQETEVVVRYSPRVARWVEEWAPDAEPSGSGGALVRHRVADPGWVVRHVLGYGGEAEVVEPAWVRGMLGGR